MDTVHACACGPHAARCPASWWLCRRYAEDVRDLIGAATPGRVAGFISETIQGVGGATPLASGYLPEVYKVRGVARAWVQREAMACSESWQPACSPLPIPLQVHAFGVRVPKP